MCVGADKLGGENFLPTGSMCLEEKFESAERESGLYIGLGLIRREKGWKVSVLGLI